MAICPTAVAIAAKDLNISLSVLDRAEELEQRASRGTLLPFLPSKKLSPPPPGYKGVHLEGNRQMLVGEYCGPGP